MELSNRLQAVADLVTPGMIVADVGTDHGYIPIYLVQSQKTERAIAMDINEGPLMRADAHIRMHRLQEKIATRLSDGVKQLAVGECDCVIIAGMGGALVQKIMTEGEEIFRNVKEFVLQPQSELEKVRRFLYEQQYRIVEEDMIYEDGKFYPMMKVVSAPDEACETYEYRYGKKLLEKKNPVLKCFLEKEIALKEQICERLSKQNGVQIAHRKNELLEEIRVAQEALQTYL